MPSARVSLAQIQLIMNTEMASNAALSVGWLRVGRPHIQFSEGFSAWSITNISTGIRCDFSANPSCCAIAVDISRRTFSAC
jgi:hypothetical protein